jgi:hypothetical protein
MNIQVTQEGIVSIWAHRFSLTDPLTSMGIVNCNGFYSLDPIFHNEIDFWNKLTLSKKFLTYP